MRSATAKLFSSPQASFFTCGVIGKRCSSIFDLWYRCGAPPRRDISLPHIVCHYSADHRMPPVGEILLALHEAAASTGVVKAEDLKLRAQAFDDYLVAGERKSFFHVTLYMLAGRTPAQKETLSVGIR